MNQKQTSNFIRQYGWDEIEQCDDEAKRLRQLLSIWDAERIAILKLQYHLDKNIFKRNNMHKMNAMTKKFFFCFFFLSLRYISLC